MTNPTAAQKSKALLLQRCPRCCEGHIYERGMKINQRCPVCDLLFEREPGYFLGAMYISYAIATAFLLTMLLIGNWFFPEIDMGWMVLICAALFVPFVPIVTRYSRVLWIYFDRWAWPARPGESD
jgi:uncharacterized protein (DUF983 family)